MRRAVNAVTSTRFSSWHEKFPLIKSFPSWKSTLQFDPIPSSLSLSLQTLQPFSARRLHSSSQSIQKRPSIVGAHWSPLCASLKSLSSERPLSTTAEDDMGESTQKLMRTFQVVVAATLENGIGKNGKLPWSLPSDMKFFKRITTETNYPGKKNAVIIGRYTWESVPEKFRPLPGRLNVILSRTMTGNDIGGSEGNVLVSGSLTDALELLAEPQYTTTIETVYVIGGGHVYR
jgi:dihydrofolate reductase